MDFCWGKGEKKGGRVNYVLVTRKGKTSGLRQRWLAAGGVSSGKKNVVLIPARAEGSGLLYVG